MKAATADRSGTVAKAVANALLSAAASSVLCGQDGRRYVNVDALCSQLGFEVIDDPSLCSRAEFRILPSLACDEMFEIRLNTDLSMHRRRFSLAHEIGHWCVHTGRLEVSPNGEERTCDEFAGHLLVPDILLDEWIDYLRMMGRGIDLQVILDGADSMRVSHDVFVRKLMRDGRHAELDQASMILIARLALSRRRRLLPSLRIDAVAPPAGYFLPLNQRLSSVGLNELASNYAGIQHWEIRTYSGVISLNDMHRHWRSTSHRCVLEYVKLSSDRSKQYLLAAGRLLDYG